MIVPDYDGLEVEGLDGGRVGRVQRTYLSEHLQIRFVEVKIGVVPQKHRLIPTSEAERTDGVLRVPYTKGTVLESPDVSGIGDTLDGDVLTAVQDYYAPPQPSDTGTSDTEATQIEEKTPVADDATGPMPLMATVAASTPGTHAEQNE